MQRWLTGILGSLVLWTVLVGCQQTCYVHEPDLVELHQRLGLPVNVENDFKAGIIPFLQPMPGPATVVDPERSVRYLGLQEAIAVALENGTIGIQAIRTPGLALDDMVTFTPTNTTPTTAPGISGAVTGSDRIRVFALQPATSAASLEAALARFDAQWLNSMVWNTLDQPVQGLSSFTNSQGATLSSALAKPLPTGGVAGITFSTVYQDLTHPPQNFFIVNPSYTTNLQFGFEQPLLRYNGVSINQILPSFPSSGLFPGINSRLSSGAPEGILIARLRFDEQRAEFERKINFMILNVEVAYWNLYGAYVTLFSQDQALRQAQEAWRITKEQEAVGTTDPVFLYQTRVQYENFRISRVQALGTVLENERNLRILLGLPMEDGTRLVPADRPTLAPYVPNWEAALADALSLRPELVLAREDLKIKQLNVEAAKTLLRPDLRFQAQYTLVGLGTRLDGGGVLNRSAGTIYANSLETLASNQFVNWNLGLTMNIPIGFRNEMAQVRLARLALAQAFEVLKDQEKKAHNVMTRQYREIFQAYKVIEAQRLRRQTTALELRNLYNKVESGTLLPAARTFGDSLLDAQQKWAQALSDEYAAIVDYNNALAMFEFTKGTIQQHNRVYIADGPLPQSAQVRAAVHEQQRINALVLNERANPFVPPTGPRSAVDHWPEDVTPALPALWKDGPPLDVPPMNPDQAIGPAPSPAAAPPAKAPSISLEGISDQPGPARDMPADLPPLPTGPRLEPPFELRTTNEDS
jgi:outer membrane protein TolC